MQAGAGAITEPVRAGELLKRPGVDAAALAELGEGPLFRSGDGGRPDGGGGGGEVLRAM